MDDANNDNHTYCQNQKLHSTVWIFTPPGASTSVRNDQW